MRLFIGIAMTAEVVQQLAAIRARLERPGDGLRWSAPEGWHITLQFLGAATPEQYQCVVAGLRDVKAKPVPVRVEGLGFFERAGVFWAGVHMTPELAALQKAVTEATCPCGYPPEDRPYSPHITLARNRAHENGIRGLKPRVGAAPEFTGFTAPEFLLYESFPGPKGSKYEVRERFGLA